MTSCKGACYLCCREGCTSVMPHSADLPEAWLQSAAATPAAPDHAGLL